MAASWVARLSGRPNGIPPDPHHRRRRRTAPMIPSRNGDAGAPDRIRTCDLRLRRPTLYPLSYRRAYWAIRPVVASGHGTRRTLNRRRPPPKRGPSLLSDSLIARASFTHGFPHYPNPNLPMALRPVVNRCANSIRRIDRLFPLDKGFAGLDSFTSQSASTNRARFRRMALGSGVEQCGDSYAASDAPVLLLSSVMTGTRHPEGPPERGRPGKSERGAAHQSCGC